MGRLIKVNAGNFQFLSGNAECGAGDGFFGMGDLVLQCPRCKTFYHLDCWTAYGSICPRNSYSCWNEKIIPINLRKIWDRIRAGSLLGGIVGGLLGILVGAVGIAVRAEHSWTIAGFVSSGIYSLLLLAIFRSYKKISFSTGFFVFVVNLIAMVSYPKIELLICVLFNVMCFIIISIFFNRDSMRVIPRVSYVLANAMFVILGTWLTILVGSGGDLLVGVVYFGIIGVVLGVAIGVDSIVS